MTTAEHYDDAALDDQRPVDWQRVEAASAQCVQVKADFLRRHVSDEVADQYLAEHRGAVRT